MSLDTVILLHAHNGKRLAKSFTTASNGRVVRSSYDKGATWFTAEAVPVEGIRDLAEMLRWLEANPHACVIRGTPAPETNLSHTRRNKITFPETPRRWVMFDIDGIPLPPGTSVLTDSGDAARAVLDILAAHAPELEGVTAVVQFSSSAGIDELAEAEEAAGLPLSWRYLAKNGVAAHVWYWLADPLGEAELKRWLLPLRAAGLAIDTATVQTVQPHYTAAPVFEAPLRDHLGGRRTVLVEGVDDAASLNVPAPQPHLSAGAGYSANAGLGFAGYLNAIGGVDGFHAPIKSAAASFVASNWPAPDLAALKNALRARILSADPGGRAQADIVRYASDSFLDGLIGWVMQQHAAGQAAQAEAAAQRVEPTFPDRGVSLDRATIQARGAVQRFAQKIGGSEKPETLLQITVGAGKSDAAIALSADILGAARAAGRTGALYYFVPRHDLGAELIERFRKAHPTLRVAVWKGIEWINPKDPNDAMCLDRELPRAARAAGLSAAEVCNACPLSSQCAYQRQRSKKADVWLLAHNLLFQEKPSGLPDAAAVVVDEAFWQAGLEGTDKLHPVQLAASALQDERTGILTGASRDLIIHRRHRAFDALTAQSGGGLLREAFEAVGFDAAAAREWQDLEWGTKPAVALKPGMAREAMLSALSDAAAQGFTRLRPMLARHVRLMMEGGDARSVGAKLVRNAELGRGQGAGDVVRFAWRRDFAAWVADAPKLFLDATTRPDVIRAWVPELVVEDIEVQAPGQRVRQVVGRPFGRAFFTKTDGNVRRLADLVVVELAQASGEVLVIAQQAPETLLREELARRFEGALPPRLHLAHHGNITGLDGFRDVERIVVVGRPALPREVGEALAEVVKGAAVAVVVDGDNGQWPAVSGGIRMEDGTGRPVTQPCHPDPLVEALRWSITEGAVIQAIGRGRGVRRDPSRPVTVTLMAELALPLAVTEVVTWDEAQPDRVTTAAAEAAISGRALPLAPVDLAAARPDLFPTPKAAELYCGRRFETPHALNKGAYKQMRGFKTQAPVRYRKGLRGRWSQALVPFSAGRAALEALTGPLAAFELARPPAVPIIALNPSLPAEAPVAPPPRAPAVLTVVPSQEPAPMPEPARVERPEAEPAQVVAARAAWLLQWVATAWEAWQPIEVETQAHTSVRLPVGLGGFAAARARWAAAEIRPG